MQVCTIIKQIQRHSFVTFYWLHEWFFCRNQRHITQSINWEILKTKSQQNSVFLNQKLSFSNLFWTSVIITFSVRSDMVRTSHLSMIAGPKDHLCKILKALTGIIRHDIGSIVIFQIWRSSRHSPLPHRRAHFSTEQDHSDRPVWGQISKLLLCTYSQLRLSVFSYISFMQSLCYYQVLSVINRQSILNARYAPFFNGI